MANALTHLGQCVQTIDLLRFLNDAALRQQGRTPLHRGASRQDVAQRRFFADQGMFRSGDYYQRMNRESLLPQRGCAMRELVFAMELHGRVTPVEGREGTMSGQTVGRGPMGETVRFTSQVVRRGETATETGRIEYLGRGAVEFDTVEALHSSPGPLPNTRWGAVIWRITAGEGGFAGASGYITSNFLVSAGGDVVDNHYVRMVLP